MTDKPHRELTLDDLHVVTRWHALEATGGLSSLSVTELDVGGVARLVGEGSPAASYWILCDMLASAEGPFPDWRRIDNESWIRWLVDAPADLDELDVSESDESKVARVNDAGGGAPGYYLLARVTPNEGESAGYSRLWLRIDNQPAGPLPTWFVATPADLETGIVSEVGDESRLARVDRNGEPEYYLLSRAYDEDDGEGNLLPRREWSRIDNAAWSVAFDAHFALMSARTFVDGWNTLNGFSWFGANLSKAEVKAIVPGQGLVLDHGPLDTGWYFGALNAPNLMVRVSTLIPQFIWGESELRVTSEFEVAGTGNYDLGGIAIERADFVANQVESVKLYAGYAPGYSRYGQSIQGSSEGVCPMPAGEKVSRVTLHSPVRASFYSALASGDTRNVDAFYPSRFSLRGIWNPATQLYGGSTAASANAPNAANVMVTRTLKSQDVCVRLGVQTGNTNNQAKLTMRRLRIEYRL